MKTTTRKLLAELQGLMDAPSEADKLRMIALASLCSSACVAVACGLDVKEAAARCTGRLRAIPKDEWPALFDEARASTQRTTSGRELPAVSELLEELIAAVQTTA